MQEIEFSEQSNEKINRYCTTNRVRHRIQYPLLYGSGFVSRQVVTHDSMVNSGRDLIWYI